MRDREDPAVRSKQPGDLPLVPAGPRHPHGPSAPAAALAELFHPLPRPRLQHDRVIYILYTQMPDYYDKFC